MHKLAALLICFAFATSAAWGAAEVVVNIEGSQQYGIIDADEETTDFQCNTGNLFISLNDGLSGGTWNSRTIAMEFQDPQAGWVPLNDDASWAADTGLVPVATLAGVPIRLNSNGAGLKISYWLRCGN